MVGKAFNFKFGGETSFLDGSSFYLGEAVFQRGRYWGVYSRFQLACIFSQYLIVIPPCLLAEDGPRKI